MLLNFFTSAFFNPSFNVIEQLEMRRWQHQKSSQLSTDRQRVSGDYHWPMDDRWELMVYSLTDGSQTCFLLEWRKSNDYGAAK